MPHLCLSALVQSISNCQLLQGRYHFLHGGPIDWVLAHALGADARQLLGHSRRELQRLVLNGHVEDHLQTSTQTQLSEANVLLLHRSGAQAGTQHPSAECSLSSGIDQILAA